MVRGIREQKLEWSVWCSGPGEAAGNQGGGLPGSCGLSVLELLGFFGTTRPFPTAVPSSIKRGLE